MKKIRVMLVDDHDMIRQGIRLLLESQPDITVVAEARDGVEAIAMAPQILPDVMVMDISMPKCDGLKATEQIAEKHPGIAILALSVHDDKQHFFKMLNVGAKGYITKQNGPEELVAAIRTVAKNEIYLQPALARFLLEDYFYTPRSGNQNLSAARIDTHSPKGFEVLSAREIAILKLIADGLTSPQIAQHLGLSPKTIGSHRERIMKKLDLHSTTSLVKFAISTGLVDFSLPLGEPRL